jgi:hypothetical protein
VGVVGRATVVRVVVRNVVGNPYVVTTSGAATATDWHRAGTDIEAGRATVDLLDANETTWALAATSCVGSATNPQVRRLAVTVEKSFRKFYCGLAADWSVGPPRPANGPALRKTHLHEHKDVS